MFVRTPHEVAALIQDKITDKIVCDVGCAEGSFMLAMGQYAQKIKGIEQVTSLANIAADRLEVSGYNGKVVNNYVSGPDDLLVADVYYIFVEYSQLRAIIDNIIEVGTSGIFIFGNHSDIFVDTYLRSKGAEVREAAAGYFKVYILEIT